MQPVLFEIAGVKVQAYVVATVLGYAVATGIGLWLGRKDGRDWRDLFDGAIVLVISAVMGAKLFHVLFEAEGHVLGGGQIAHSVWDLLRADPWHWARLFEPGYVFYGGVVVASLMVLLFVYRRAIEDPFAAGDYAAPGFALGIAIGRLGCYFAGCCFGVPTDVPWAVHFPASHATGGVGVHPTQLYDVAFGLVAFAACVWYWPRRKFGGDLFARLLVAYGTWRFLVEFFRGDGDRGVWLGGALSTSQLVSLTVVPITCAVWWWMNKTQRGRYFERYPAGGRPAALGSDTPEESPA